MHRIGLHEVTLYLYYIAKTIEKNKARTSLLTSQYILLMETQEIVRTSICDSIFASFYLLNDDYSHHIKSLDEASIKSYNTRYLPYHQTERKETEIPIK